MYKILTITMSLAFILVAVPNSADAKGGTISGKVDAKKKKYVKNTLVYLVKVPGKHATKNKKMDQLNQKFVPFVLPVVKGSSVKFLNNDNTGHNVFTPDGEKYDLGTWKKGKSKSYTFKKEGVYTQLCKLHPSMIAYVISLQNPYFAVTKDDGSFKIENVPAGTYKLAVWNERKKAKPVSVTVTAGKTTDISLRVGK